MGVSEVTESRGESQQRCFFKTNTSSIQVEGEDLTKETRVAQQGSQYLFDKRTLPFFPQSFSWAHLPWNNLWGMVI